MGTKLRWVETYSGYRLNERPLWFIYQDELLQVKELLEQSRTPQGDQFRVLASNGIIYNLMHLPTEDHWEIDRLS